MAESRSLLLMFAHVSLSSWQVLLHTTLIAVSNFHLLSHIFAIYGDNNLGWLFLVHSFMERPVFRFRSWACLWWKGYCRWWRMFLYMVLMLHFYATLWWSLKHGQWLLKKFMNSLTLPFTLQTMRFGHTKCTTWSYSYSCNSKDLYNKLSLYCFSRL